MSLIKNLKMRCNIYRLPTVSVEELLDDYQNYNPQFSLLYPDVKCFIHSLEFASGKLTLQGYGQDKQNMYLCFIEKDQDILSGDRVSCTTFNPSDFYVRSVNPITNGRTGKVSHKECVLSIEKPN